MLEMEERPCGQLNTAPGRTRHLSLSSDSPWIKHCTGGRMPQPDHSRSRGFASVFSSFS